MEQQQQVATPRTRRIGRSAVGAIVAGGLSYMSGRIAEKWGILDPIADTIGGWLKVHVPPETAALTFSFILFAVLYGVILWRVWRPHHIHHLPIQAETRPVASLEMEVIRAASTDPAGIGSRAALAPSRPTLWDRLEERTRGSFLRRMYAAKHRETMDRAMDRATEGLGTIGDPPPPPETWMPLDEAIRYLANGSQWGDEQDHSDPNFSGRKYRGAVRHNDPLVPIPASHFEDYGFGHGVLGYDVTDNEASHTGDIRMMTLGQRGKEDVTYYDLHLSERDARKVIRAFSKDPKIEQS